MALEDLVHARAFDETHALLSAGESEAEFRWEWKSVPLKHPSGMRTKQLILPTARPHAQFEGRTFRQECDRREALYRSENPPIITERFSVDRSYAYGIGLHAVVAETTLDRAAIERTIQSFRDIGERDWRGV